MKKKKKRKKKLNPGLASLRHGTGLRETAESESSSLLDFGVVTEKYLTMVIDHNKVKGHRHIQSEW